MYKESDDKCEIGRYLIRILGWVGCEAALSLKNQARDRTPFEYELLNCDHPAVSPSKLSSTK